MKYMLWLLLLPMFGVVNAQPGEKKFTHADTLRGSITPERAWWNVLRYDVTIRPNYVQKTTAGSNELTYQVISNNDNKVMQIDLQEPLHIDSIVYNGGDKLGYTREGNAWHVVVPDQVMAAVNKLKIYYSGKPHEAMRPPWDGGWTFSTNSLGRPWMTVTCQGIGASIWYPCKDHQSDEPDNGASLTMIVPDTLVAVANGRLQQKINNNDGTKTYTWAVTNPINNYDLIPYIGKYVNFGEVYNGLKGKLDINYWVLDYNEAKARSYMPNEVHNMLNAFEFWFGPYPFYEDGYKLVDVQHPGMEHQSAVAYGNYYKPGYRNRDNSGTGWGMKWDFIIVHESGHEWFGNNITSDDLADMWIHEGFTNYSETLFVDYIFGKQAADEYNAGTRKGIRNDRPIIPAYGVNEEGSGDMYPKSGNMLHSIRHGLDDDTLFRQILKGLNTTFYHQTVTANQIINYVNEQAHFDYTNVFRQYLTTTQIPKLEVKLSTDHKKVSYRYVDCIDGFNLPLVLKNEKQKIRLVPTTEWASKKIRNDQVDLFEPAAIEKMYYINVVAL